MNQSFLKKFLELQFKYYHLFVLLGLALCLVCLPQVLKIGIDTNLVSLLPENSTVVKNSKIIADKTGSGSDLVLMISGSSFEKRLEAAEALKQHILAIPNLTKTVEYKTHKEFFENNKYLLIPNPQLDRVLEVVEKIRKENADITDSLGLERIQDEETKAAAKKTEAPADSTRSLEEADSYLAQLDELRPYLMTPDKKFVAVRVVPRQPEYNLEQSKLFIDQIRNSLADFDLAAIDPDLRLNIEGSLERLVSRYQDILRDLQIGIGGLLGIVVVLFFYFRSILSIFSILPPLIIGISAGLAIVRMIEGSLNTIAVFLVLVVFGLGVEFGIHLMTRYLQERRRFGVKRSLFATWHSTGRAVVTSSVALIFGFSLFLVSSFQGFSQFGRVALILLSTAALSYLVFMPSWIILCEKIKSFENWRSTFNKNIHLKGWKWPKLARAGRVISLLLIVGLGALSLQGVRFDYNFDVRQTKKNPSESWTASYQLFSQRTKPSAYALFPGDEKERSFELINFFESHKENYPGIDTMVGASSLFPPDQKERLDKLQQISDDLQPSWVKEIDQPRVRQAMIEIIENAYDFNLIEQDSIPQSLLQKFEATDGSGDQLVIIFDQRGEADARKAMRFSRDVNRVIEDSSVNAVASGGELIFADVVARVTNEGPWLVLGMFFLIFMICLVDFRSIRFALIALSPIAFGFLLLGGFMSGFTWKINFFNMISIASLSCMVVDNSIHFLHRYLDLKKRGLRASGFPELDAWRSVSPAITACTLTSICGYFGMLFAGHNGVFSLGRIAVVGMICCWVATIFFFPTWLNIFKTELKKDR